MYDTRIIDGGFVASVLRLRFPDLAAFYPRVLHRFRDQFAFSLQFAPVEMSSLEIMLLYDQHHTRMQDATRESHQA
ncbi:hypothetical protein A3718_07410 [Erythrobacter sp. HI0019]|nr:hypothetical protein A3718_07410 [Erythrobacter sp. HI0019]